VLPAPVPDGRQGAPLLSCRVPRRKRLHVQHTRSLELLVGADVLIRVRDHTTDCLGGIEPMWDQVMLCQI